MGDCDDDEDDEIRREIVIAIGKRIGRFILILIRVCGGDLGMDLMG